MKKLLLITFLFLITPDAKADMDYVCLTNHKESAVFILDNCERNNILYMTRVPEEHRLSQPALWCRQDREINIIFSMVSSEGEKLFEFSCVLYDNKPRKLIN